MELSLLNHLFNGQVEIDFFKRMISNEVGVYKEQLKKKGSVVSIDIKDDCSLNFRADNLVQLCRYFIDEKLDVSELAYIADALCLSENVNYEKESLVDYLEEMTDPEVNGLFSKKLALQIIEKITTDG